MKVTTPISVTYREAAGFFPLAVRSAALAIGESMEVLTDGGGLGIQSARSNERHSIDRQTRNSGIGESLEKKKLIASRKSAPPNQKNRNHRIKSGGAVEEMFPHSGGLPPGVAMRRVPFLFAFFYPSRNKCFRADHNGHSVVACPKSLRGDQ